MDCFEFFNYANIFFFQKIGVRSKIRFVNIWQKKKKCGITDMKNQYTNFKIWSQWGKTNFTNPYGTHCM